MQNLNMARSAIAYVLRVARFLIARAHLAADSPKGREVTAMRRDRVTGHGHIGRRLSLSFGGVPARRPVVRVCRRGA